MINKNIKTIWVEKFDSFSIMGKDAKRFLNGITTSNMKLQKEIILTCWLSPKGNLRSILEIHVKNDRLFVIVLEGDIIEIKKYCEDMIFPSDDVSIGTNYQILRLQQVTEKDSWRKFSSKIINEINLKKYYEENKIEILNENDLKVWKKMQAFPVYKKEIDGNNNPIELGLTDLIDFNKGCYLGQETMARMRKISTLKQEIRFWISINNKNSKLTDKKIFLDQNKNKVVGYITSYVSAKSNQVCGIAMLKKNYFENKNKNKFFSEDFGFIKISKSVSSVFL